MKRLLLVMLVIFFVQHSSAQLTKNSWLVGGTGHFAARSNILSDESVGLGNSRTTNYQLTPNVGYFLADKLAAGLELNFEISRQKTKSLSLAFPEGYNIYISRSYGFGPFLRYYFLPVKKQFNILVEGGYQYNIIQGGGVFSPEGQGVDVPMGKASGNKYSIAAGPVMFFNPHVGMEFLLGYSTSGYNNTDIRENVFQVGIGLQIHLGKGK